MFNTWFGTCTCMQPLHNANIEIIFILRASYGLLILLIEMLDLLLWSFKKKKHFSKKRFDKK